MSELRDRLEANARRRFFETLEPHFEVLGRAIASEELSETLRDVYKIGSAEDERLDNSTPREVLERWVLDRVATLDLKREVGVIFEQAGLLKVRLRHGLESIRWLLASSKNKGPSLVILQGQSLLVWLSHHDGHAHWSRRFSGKVQWAPAEDHAPTRGCRDSACGCRRFKPGSGPVCACGHEHGKN